MAWAGEGRRMTGPFATSTILGKIDLAEQCETLLKGMIFQANLFR